MNRFIMALAALCTLAIPAAASAQAVPTTAGPGTVASGLYNLVFSGTDVADIVNGNLDLTIGSNGHIDAASGQINGLNISGTSTYASADNILFDTSTGGALVDFGGISFAADGGLLFNIGNMGAPFLQYGIVNSGNNSQGYCCFAGDGVVHPITMNLAAVPEPATWALMLLGFGGMGMAMRRTRRNVLIPQLA